ncbi:helix-turn-helix domain-containing protein [Spongiactinospora rosea]|uniref:helix-turn-helix domain-containing protein n=1 Tax=Spongiactinospora rosea TaxID=2248750 RepID=UPI0013146AAD
MTENPPNSPDTPEKRFGRELRRVRKEAGLSQTRVGRACGCSASLVSSVERATRVPQPDFARGLDRLFGLNQFFTRLAKGIGEPPPSGPEWFTRWAEEIEPDNSCHMTLSAAMASCQALSRGRGPRRPMAVSVESAVGGEVTSNPEALALVLARYERIRAEAYRSGHSVKLIQEAWEQWTSQD